MRIIKYRLRKEVKQKNRAPEEDEAQQQNGGTRMRIKDIEDLAIAEQLSSSSPRLVGEVVPGKGRKFTIENFERKRRTEKILNGMIDQMNFWHKSIDRPAVRDRQRRRRRGPRTLVAQGYIPKKESDQSQR